MSEISWSTRSIRECLAESFAGEWGAEPLPGNAHVLRATDIDDDGHVIGSGALRRLPIGKLTSRQLEDGDILLEGSGGGPDKPVGRVAFFDAVEHQGPAVCSNFFKTLRPDRRVAEPRFLWRKLMWFYRQPMLLTFQQQTTGIINLKFEEYLNATIEVPADLAEQSVIAQLLDTLDTAIRETEALIDKLKAVKQGLLHDLLTRGIDADGQLRPPQSEAPQLYKESPLGWIPNEWEAVELNQLIDPKRPVVYGILMPGYGHPGGVPVVKVKDIFDGKIHLNDLLLTSPQIDREYSRSRLKAGDLLFTIRGTVGRTAFVPPVLDSANITQDTARLAVTGTDARFLRAYLGMAVPSRFIATHTLGVAVQGINLRDVRRIPIARPSALEAKAIADEIQSQERRLESESLSVAKLRLAKAGLLDDLLTGRVRVTPLLESVQQAATQTGS
ncbi:MAG: restriction endonuclease subunit S [Pseudomonas sp.]|nr:MAG: restriction endonuclease subunit S [Pseudomonas sp.]